MNISFIPRAKAESLAQTKPFLLSSVTMATDDTRFIMITEEGGIFTTIFDLAMVDEEDNIIFLSNEAHRSLVESFLRENR